MAIVRMLVKVGALAGLSSVMVVQMLAQPRIFLSMAKDGLLPPWAGRVHPRFRTPHIATHRDRRRSSRWPPASRRSARSATLVSIGTLLAFVIVSLGIIVLRRTRPGSATAVPHAVGAVAADAVGGRSASLLMPACRGATWERLIIWMAIGVVLYFAYRQKAQPVTSQIGSYGVLPGSQ